MNAAATVMHQSNVFSGQFSDIRLSKQLCLPLVLIVAVLISALLVIYAINQHRLTFSQLEVAEQSAHQLQLQWGQLLLEQASLATPARVQELATEKLLMVLPVNKQVVIMRVK